MKSCARFVGLLLISVVDIATIISFATPYWLKQLYITLYPNENSNIPLQLYQDNGLWMSCRHHGCVWIFEDLSKAQLTDEAWFHASQGLMCLGLLFGIMAFVVATSAVCCQCCRGRCHAATQISVYLLCCCLCIAMAVIVFGAKASKIYNAKLDSRGNSHNMFGWSFWLGAVAGGMAFITSFLYWCIHDEK